MSSKAQFVIVSQASVLLPILIGLFYYKRLTIPFRVLFYSILIFLGFEFVASITRIVYHNNMPGLHVFTIVQLIAFSVIYYLDFQDNRVLKRLILVNVIIALFIAILDAFFVNDIWHHNTLSRSYCSASVVIYTLVYFYRLFQKDTTKYSWEFPMFWVSIGALIYSAINILYFMLKQYLLMKATSIETFSYYVFLSTNIVTYCLYAQSFRCFRKWKEE